MRIFTYPEFTSSFPPLARCDAPRPLFLFPGFFSPTVLSKAFSPPPGRRFFPADKDAPFVRIRIAFFFSQPLFQ